MPQTHLSEGACVYKGQQLDLWQVLSLNNASSSLHRCAVFSLLPEEGSKSNTKMQNKS